MFYTHTHAWHVWCLYACSDEPLAIGSLQYHYNWIIICRPHELLQHELADVMTVLEFPKHAAPTPGGSASAGHPAGSMTAGQPSWTAGPSTSNHSKDAPHASATEPPPTPRPAPVEHVLFRGLRLRGVVLGLKGCTNLVLNHNR
jgi:hypothetical protein